MLVNASGGAVILTGMGWLVESVTGLFVALILAALLYGLANPAANLALASRVPAARQGLIFGLKHGGIPTSSLLAGLGVPLIALTAGWRWVFGASAAMAFAVIALIPRDDTETDLGTVEPAGSDRGMNQSWLTLLSLGSAFATVGAIALAAFHVDAAIDAGFSESEAGLVLAGGSAASITARVAYGYWADRRGANGLGWVRMAALVGATAFIGFIVLPENWFVPVTLIAFATGWGWPGLMTFGVVRANRGRPAGSTAITQAGVFLGAGLGPVGLGWLIETRSYEVAWLVTAAALAIAAAIVTVVERRGLTPVAGT